MIAVNHTHVSLRAYQHDIILHNTCQSMIFVHLVLFIIFIVLDSRTNNSQLIIISISFIVLFIQPESRSGFNTKDGRSQEVVSTQKIGITQSRVVSLACFHLARHRHEYNCLLLDDSMTEPQSMETFFLISDLSPFTFGSSFYLLSFGE